MTNNWVFENVYGASGLSVFTKCGTTNLVGGYLRFGAVIKLFIFVLIRKQAQLRHSSYHHIRPYVYRFKYGK
jgi:hypothetical protein